MMPSHSGYSREDLCLICQDAATGYHYAVPSCNGCKTFFRRTIMKNKKYICQFERNCPVDKSIRGICRFCRFEKCIQVGMDKNALQQNRDPIGYTKRTRKPTAIKQMSSPDSGEEMNRTSADRETSGNYLHVLSLREKCANDLRLSEYLPSRTLREALCSKSLLNDPIFMNKFGSPSKRHTFKELRFIEPSDYYYWHERDWFLLTEYAKTFDLFSNLPYEDKVQLVRHAGIAVLVLVQCFNSPDLGMDTVAFPDGAYFDRRPEPKRPAGLNRKKYQMLDLVLKPMREIQVDHVEFAALKAITFLNPDAEVCTESRLLVNNERIAITKQLYTYMIRKSGIEKAIERFTRLMSMSWSMSRISCESKDALWFAGFFHYIGYSHMAKEIFFDGDSENSNDMIHE